MQVDPIGAPGRSPGLADAKREVFHGDGVPRGQDHRVLDRVPQLPNVPWPRIPEQSVHRRRPDPTDRFPVRPTGLRQEGADQKGEILATFPERGQMDLHSAEAKVEVLAEATLLEDPVDAPIRGGDDPHVDGDLPGPPEAPVGMALEHAEELRLSGERHVRHLVQEQRALMRELEAALFADGRSGEGSALVPEELVLEQVGRQRCAVDRDERVGRPRRKPVHGPGHQLLPGAALTGNENAGPRRRNALDEIEHFDHPRASSHHPVDPWLRVRRRNTDGLEGRADPLSLQHLRDQLQEALGIDRLGEVVERITPYRFDRGLNRAPAG